MTFERFIALLVQVGIPEEILNEADENWQIRHDLALTSAETVALQAKIEHLAPLGFSLWGAEDYSLGEIISLLR